MNEKTIKRWLDESNEVLKKLDLGDIIHRPDSESFRIEKIGMDIFYHPKGDPYSGIQFEVTVDDNNADGFLDIGMYDDFRWALASAIGAYYSGKATNFFDQIADRKRGE